jgi:hypothetical protein
MWRNLRRFSPLFLAATALLASESAHAAFFANSVISADAGIKAGDGQYEDPTNTLGRPPAGNAGSEGSGGGLLTPFNANFDANETDFGTLDGDQLFQVGEGGHITLQLSRYAQPGSGPELGVFENAALADQHFTDDTRRQAYDPALAFGASNAVVEVSERGENFQALNGGSPINFNMPANAYNNAEPVASAPPADAEPADFGKPFTEPMSAFNGETFDEVLATLDGSGGGNWLDLSEAGLSRIGVVRFSVPDDNDPNTANKFDLDAVSISNTAVGAPVQAAPEPTTAAMLLVGGSLCVAGRRRRA